MKYLLDSHQETKFLEVIEVLIQVSFGSNIINCEKIEKNAKEKVLIQIQVLKMSPLLKMEGYSF